MIRATLLTYVALLVCITNTAAIDLSAIALKPGAVKEPVTATFTRQPVAVDSVLSLKLTLHMDSIVHIYEAESLFFKLYLNDSAGITEHSFVMPHAHDFKNFDGSTVKVYMDGQQFILNGRITKDSWQIAGRLHFQACDAQMCFTPRSIAFSASSDGIMNADVVSPTMGISDNTSGTAIGSSEKIMEMLNNFTTRGVRGGYLKAEEFGAFMDDPGAGDTGGTSLFDGKGLAAIILIILLGGIALNLTPCVLPMIPVTLAVIGAGAQAQSRGKGLLTGAIYGLAMALTYGILGLVVVLSGTRFGVINASPVFNIAIALLFVFMALAMFDIIQIDFTRFRKAGKESKNRGKFATVFAMGIVASLLAGACVAPVVIAVVLYSGKLYADGSVVGLSLPFLLGLGMALPWPFAGAGLSLLPKPGKWMVWVKYVFGVFILGMALYYGITGAKLFKKEMPPNVPAAAVSEYASEESSVWGSDLSAALLQAQREKRPVLIDFWATWCKNCKAMDATTFKDPAIVKRLENVAAVKFQAEKPDEPSTKAILDRFGIVGLPSYVILEPVVNE